MRQVTVTQAHLKSGIPIGRLGEQEATQVVFPLDELIAVFGDGTFSLVHQRRKDRFSYPCSTERVGDNLIWTIMPFDVYWEGKGQCELILSKEGTIAYDSIYPTIVGPSLILQSEEPPEPFEPWFNKILSAADRMDGQTFYTLKKVSDYCYSTEYGVIDYEGALKYFKDAKAELVPFGCSSMRNGNYYGRNFDWTYDETAEFIVHTPNVAGRNEVLGVAGGFKTLSKEFVESGEKSELYKWMPFQLRDGINEFGLVANLNVVSADYGIYNIEPLDTQEIELSCLMVIRYLLDNFKTAKSAVEYLRDHIAIYYPQGLVDMNYDVHYMIADQQDTYVVEFRDGRAVVIDVTNGNQFMTNFYLNGINLNEDGSVYTPETQDEEHDAIRTNLIQPHGMGLERYNLINARIREIHSEVGMQSLLNELQYTHAYTSSDAPADPYWYTEFTGDELYVNSEITDFDDIVEAAAIEFSRRVRDGKTWQTTHSSVYDLATLELWVQVQESGEWTSFSITQKGGGTDRHDQLRNRNLNDQHPIGSITNLNETLETKQGLIEDLDEIRSNALAGSTAYHKPNGGIPKSDIAENVIPDQLSDLSSDRSHRTVTDTQINNWNNKPENWDGLQSKPFSQIGDGLIVENGILKIDRTILLSILEELI